MFCREIRRSLVSFLKASTRTTDDLTERNPSWILCLPIVNFLDGNLQPFEELDYTNFQDKNTEWWIVRDFETEKNEIKPRKWSRYIMSYDDITCIQQIKFEVSRLKQTFKTKANFSFIRSRWF